MAGIMLRTEDSIVVEVKYRAPANMLWDNVTLHGKIMHKLLAFDITESLIGD